MGYIYIITIISLFFLRVTRENIPCGQHRNAQGAVSPVETRTRRWGPAGQVQVSERAAGRQQAPPWGSGAAFSPREHLPSRLQPSALPHHNRSAQRVAGRTARPGGWGGSEGSGAGPPGEPQLPWSSGSSSRKWTQAEQGGTVIPQGREEALGGGWGAGGDVGAPGG